MPTVNLDTASRLDIICRKGDTFRLVLDFGQDMEAPATDWKMQVASSDTASAATLTLEGSANFEVGANSDGVSGAKITITATSTSMAAIPSGLYVYDIQTDDTAGTGGEVKTHVYGTFKVNEDITTPDVA